MYSQTRRSTSRSSRRRAAGMLLALLTALPATTHFRRLFAQTQAKTETEAKIEKAAVPVDAFARAGRDYAAGRWNEAALGYRTLLGQQPNHPRATAAQFLLGECLLQLDRPAEAAAAFRAVLARPAVPRYTPVARFRLGQIALASERWDEARRELAKFVELAPKDDLAAYACLDLAELALTHGDAADARKWLAVAAESPTADELSDEAARLTGRLALKEADYSSAEQIFRTLVESARDDLNAADSSATAADRYQLAVALLGLREFDAALESVAPINDAQLADDLRPSLAVVRASALMQLEHFDDALTQLGQYLELHGDQRDAGWILRTYVQVRLARGEVGSAAVAARELLPSPTDLQLAASEDHDLPDTIALVIEVADRAYASRFPNLSAPLYSQLAELARSAEFPDLASRRLDFLIGLGRSHLPLLDWRAAESAFDQVVREAPDSDHAADARLGLAEASRGAGRLDDSVARYEELIAATPPRRELPAALLGAARVHLLCRDAARAEPLLRRVVTEFPALRDRDAARYCWAWALGELGRRDDSQAEFRKLMVESPQSPYALDGAYRLALQAWHEQRPDAARTQLAPLLATPATAPDLQCHAKYLLGVIAATEGKWAECVERMTDVERSLARTGQSGRRPGPASEHERLQDGAGYWLAEAAYQSGRNDEAERRFTSLDVAERELAAMACLRLGQLAGRREAWQEAFQFAKRVITDHAEFRYSYEAESLAGDCFARAGDHAAARQCWDRVVRSAAGGQTECAATARMRLGESWEAEKDWQQAIRAYDAVIRQPSGGVWHARAQLRAAACEQQLGNWPEAVRRYAYVLQHFPTSAEAESAAVAMRAARRSALAAR